MNQLKRVVLRGIVTLAVAGAACATSKPDAPTAASAPAASAPAPIPVVLPSAEAVCPKCQRIFDGTTWEGWEHDEQNWSIVEGAMRGFGKGARSAFTRNDHGDFRLIVTSRMAPVNKDHLGILFWGPRPEPGSLKQEKTIQVQPPHGAMWDYIENKNLPREQVEKGSRDFESWNVTEVLANLKTGSLRMAVNGREIVRYTDKEPARLQKGPIGMQKHGSGGSEYKDIFLEIDPSEDRLLTVPGSAPVAPVAAPAPVVVQ